MPNKSFEWNAQQPLKVENSNATLKKRTMMESQNMMGAFKIVKTLCVNLWNESKEPNVNENKPQIQRELD